MCGIAGILGFKGNEINNIEAMNAAMLQRGPDAGAYEIFEKHRVAFGHRRLAIIDLSDAGKQPMTSHDGRYIIVFNGEIYNANQLAEKLDLQWHGHSDTEVLLELIARLGIDEAVSKCRGMWGLAVYDKDTGKVCLSRDRVGEKPLFYGYVNGQFVFSSSLSSIKNVDGFSADINESVLGDYLKRGYIPAPYTIYKDIFKLEPGTILEIAPPYTEYDIRLYYDITQVALRGQVTDSFTGSLTEAADELEALLRDTLSGQMLSDVPLGAFLSGGIDSSLVVSIMQSISKRPVETFTIGFEEAGYDEAVYASQIANHLGTKHIQMYVCDEDMMKIVDELPAVFGEPYADSSALPTMLVSQMTRQHVTVAISGDAGDELFCGYNTYKEAQNVIRTMSGKLGLIKDPLRGMIGRRLLASDLLCNEATFKLGRCFTIRTVEDFYRMVSDDNYLLSKMCKRYGLLPTKVAAYEDGLLATNESNLQLMDMLMYLPDDILTKVDRAGMHYSLETRIPLLDKNIVEFAWSLPLEYKMKDGVTKRCLREVLYKHVPQELIERPKKGFSVPVSRWLRDGQMKQWAEATLADNRDVLSQLVDINIVDRLWMDYQTTGKWHRSIWHLLMLAKWCEEL